MLASDKIETGYFEKFHLTRQAFKSARRRYLLTLGTCLAAFAAADPAMADFAESEVIMLLPANIEVKSVGFNYTEVTAGSTAIQGDMSVVVEAGVSGRVKEWSGWPTLTVNEVGGISGKFQTNGDSVSYSIPRPKTVNTSYPFTITRQQYASFMVLACDVKADKLRSQGMSNAEVFGEDRPIVVRVKGALNYEVSGIEGEPVPPEVEPSVSVADVTVICKGDATPLDPVGPAITYSNVSVVESNSLSGSCTLKLAGTLSSKQANTEVKFVYVDDTGKQSDLKTVTTNAAGNVNFQHLYPAPGGGKKTGKIRMIGQGPAFMSPWTDYKTNCLPPAGGLATILPPKAFHIEGNPTAERVELQGRLCPVRANIYGIVKGRGKATGVAAVLAKGLPKGLKQYDVEDGDTVIVEGQYVLNWENTNAKQQYVKLELLVTGKTGALLDKIEKMQAFTCEAPKTNIQMQGAPGGLSTGKPSPLASQSPGKSGKTTKAVKTPKIVKKPHVAEKKKVIGTATMPFTIQSPKGVIKAGRIRLSGGTPEDKYRLRFLRKTKAGAYKAVGSRQLPRFMTGSTAKFPLRPLSASRNWRLEICKLEQAKKPLCKTTNFKVPAVKTSKSLKKSP